MAKKKEILTSTQRAFAGAILTLVNLEDGELKVVQVAGYKYEAASVEYSYMLETALADKLKEVERWPGEWRLRTLSTPQTVYADITIRSHGGRWRRQEVQRPEHNILHRIGYGHMLEVPNRMD